ncbi:unnamed protein product [Cylindrotheca closterium]|uniref:Uncharacterized protein n=1 Tax=Cylindrotheca closterium TaxID=2856 RepID=A0AAD2JMB3_9STRA|nr:unnamed protein product [Cylindrotheca closterium]
MSVLPQTSSPKTTTTKTQRETLDEPKMETAQRKKVRFHGRIKRRNIHYIPEQEHVNVWYKSTDYAEARKRESLLRQCVSTNNELYCKSRENLNAQGIFTHEQALKRDAAIEASIMAVIKEQERQESAFYDVNKCGHFSINANMIAQSYRSYAKESLEKAQNRAARHEKHVQDIACKPESPSSPCSPSRFMKNIPTQRSGKSFSRSGMQIPSPSLLVMHEQGFSPEVTTPAA